MTDNEQWQSPGYTPPGPPQPGYTPPASAPQPGYQPPPGLGRPGWTPPPKPGLIPLRPLSFGTILGAPYQALRRNPRPTFGASLLIQGGILFLTIVVVGLATWASFSRVAFSEGGEASDEIIAGAFGTVLLSALIPVALSIIATTVMQGIVVLEVSRQSLGERLRLPQLWARAKGRIWALVGYSLLATLAALLAVGAIAGIAVALSLLGTEGVIAAVLISIVLSLGVVAAAAWLTTKLAFVPSIIMLERATILHAIARSWRLTGGSFWRIFGTILLVAVILNIASSIITAPLQIVVSLSTAVFAPTGDETALIVLFIVTYLVAILGTLVFSAVAIVVQSATTVLLYIDQRMRKEGLDLELARFVEARQSGTAGVPDPYEHVPGSPPSWA